MRYCCTCIAQTQNRLIRLTSSASCSPVPESHHFQTHKAPSYGHLLLDLCIQCSTICGAIDDRSISLKAIDECVFTKFCDKNAVFTNLRNKNAVFIHFCDKNAVFTHFCVKNQTIQRKFVIDRTDFLSVENLFY